MAMEITILNGVDVLANAFNAIAAFVNNKTWFSLIKISEFIGVIAAAIFYIKSQDLKIFFKWLLGFVLINALLLTPKERVVIKDLANPTKIQVVDNVPLGVAFPLYMTTTIGNSISQSYDLFFSSNEDMQYSKTGLLFGQRLFEESLYLQPEDPIVQANLSSYIKSCLIERSMISPNTSFKAMKDNTNLMTYLYSGSKADFTSYISGNTKSFQRCDIAGKEIAKEINKIAASDMPIRKLLKGLMLPSVTAPITYNNKVSNVQQYFIGSSKSAVDIYKQNMLVNSFKRSLNEYPASLDATSDLIAQASEQSLTKMKLAHLSSYQIAGRMLPALHTTLLVLMVGIFPVMVMAMFIRELAWGVIKNYLAVLFSLMMWPVLFAVFNSVINVLTYQTLNGEAFTLSNADRLKENATSIAGVASWLMLSIPFISFRLVTNLGQNIASAGSYLGNALASATTADAASTAAGNYSWGNMQMENINGNKVDLNYVTKMGMRSQQLENGAMRMDTPSGQSIYDTTGSISKLPFAFSIGKMLDSSLISAQQSLERQSEAYSQGYRNSTMQARDSANQLLSKYSKSELMEKGLTENDISSLQNVARASNSSSSDISSGYSNQSGADKSTAYSNSETLGGSAGFKVFGIGGTASAEINRKNTDNFSSSNNMSSNQSESYSDSWVNSKEASHIANINESRMSKISDSNLRSLMKSVSDSVKTAQDNFNGFTATQGRENMISQTANLTDSQRLQIDNNLQQEFVNYVRSKYDSNQADYILTDGSANARIMREGIINEYSETFRQRLMDINDRQIERVLNNGSFNNGNSYNKFITNNPFPTRNLENEARQMGINIDKLETIDKNSKRNLDIQQGVIKQSGYNQANFNAAKDSHRIVREANNKSFNKK